MRTMCGSATRGVFCVCLLGDGFYRSFFCGDCIKAPSATRIDYLPTFRSKRSRRFRLFSRRNKCLSCRIKYDSFLQLNQICYILLALYRNACYVLRRNLIKPVSVYVYVYSLGSSLTSYADVKL